MIGLTQLHNLEPKPTPLDGNIQNLAVIFCFVFLISPLNRQHTGKSVNVTW